jgi:hypothetical protein
MQNGIAVSPLKNRAKSLIAYITEAKMMISLPTER